jgi:alpha-ketoglutarate-dependent taurine dioxygenase
MGAEIQNVDLRHLDAATFAELSDALHHHKMVFIRQQNLSFEDQEQLTLRFGEFGIDAYTTGIDGHPNVQRLLKTAEQKSSVIFGGSWHTDSPFLPPPPAISLLYGIDIPLYGGGTLWANNRRRSGGLGRYNAGHARTLEGAHVGASNLGRIKKFRSAWSASDICFHGYRPERA